jgi:hypothetical protein
VRSSWRSGNCSEVLINYFGENAKLEEGGTVETNTKQIDGPEMGKRGPAQKTASVGPKQNTIKPKRWYWVHKVQALHPHLGFVVSAAVRCRGEICGVVEGAPLGRKVLR